MQAFNNVFKKTVLDGEFKEAFTIASACLLAAGTYTHLASFMGMSVFSTAPIVTLSMALNPVTAPIFIGGTVALTFVITAIIFDRMVTVAAPIPPRQ